MVGVRGGLGRSASATVAVAEVGLGHLRNVERVRVLGLDGERRRAPCSATAASRARRQRASASSRSASSRRRMRSLVIAYAPSTDFFAITWSR